MYSHHNRFVPARPFASRVPQLMPSFHMYTIEPTPEGAKCTFCIKLEGLLRQVGAAFISTEVKRGTDEVDRLEAITGNRRFPKLFLSLPGNTEMYVGNYNETLRVIHSIEEGRLPPSITHGSDVAVSFDDEASSSVTVEEATDNNCPVIVPGPEFVHSMSVMARFSPSAFVTPADGNICGHMALVSAQWDTIRNAAMWSTDRRKSTRALDPLFKGMGALCNPRVMSLGERIVVLDALLDCIMKDILVVSVATGNIESGESIIKRLRAVVGAVRSDPPLPEYRENELRTLVSQLANAPPLMEEFVMDGEF